MDFISWLEKFTNVKVTKNQKMGKYTGYGIGGACDYFIQVTSVRDLREVIYCCQEKGVKYKVLGNGTNVLFLSDGYDGAVISTKLLDGIYRTQKGIRCLCGTCLISVVNALEKENIFSLSALSGIPASIGGAVNMNASCYGQSVSNFVNSVEVLRNGKAENLSVEECGFRYRGSRLLDKKEVVISVTLDYEKLKKTKDFLSVNEYSERRKNNQPKGRNCGCVFKNPPNDYAGRIIELCGLKGERVGNARISNVHANFIEIDEGVTPEDVYFLAQKVKEKVKEKFNVTLEPEIEFVGKCF